MPVSSVSTTPMASSGQSLFTYGSLMCADIMAEVVGRQLPATPATLTGFCRYLVQGEHYPGVVPERSRVVAGMVYHGLTGEGWTRLDLFEGEMYDRQPVTVQYDTGVVALVDCYLFRPEFIHRLTANEWDYTTFLSHGKTTFQQQYCGFKAIDRRSGRDSDGPEPIRIRSISQVRSCPCV